MRSVSSAICTSGEPVSVSWVRYFSIVAVDAGTTEVTIRPTTNTAAGGAFGGMLKVARLGPAIQALFGDTAVSGLPLLFFAFFIASLIKFAQGSSTSAMIVTSGMIAAMVSPESLTVNPVYLATAIGSGSLVGSWMNDSGFWIFARMGGLTEVETLKTWTPLLALLGSVGMAVTFILAILIPGV